MKRIDIIPMKRRYWHYLLDYINGKLYKFSEKSLVLKEIGCPNKDGYLIFGLDKKMKLVHRYLYEQFHGITLTPDIKLDHINRVRTDNRIENLRISTDSHNSQNQGKQKNNQSGFKGVSYYKKNEKWVALIGINGKLKHLGYFETPEEASEAYKKKARELNQQGHNYFFDE